MSRKKLEHALYRAVEDLPRPGLDAVSGPPVVRMEVHDYITRPASPDPRLRRRRLASLAAAVCLLAVIAGAAVWTQFFQIYSTVELSVNPHFSIRLNRRDQVRAVDGVNGDAQALLEGRSYRGWTLEATVNSLMDELALKGYLTSPQDQVDVLAASKALPHAQKLREEVEALVAAKLSGLDAPEPEPAPSPEPTPSVTATLVIAFVLVGLGYLFADALLLGVLFLPGMLTARYFVPQLSFENRRQGILDTVYLALAILGIEYLSLMLGHAVVLGADEGGMPGLLLNPPFILLVLTALIAPEIALEKHLERRCPYARSISFVSDRRKITLDPAEISYVESNDSEVWIHTAGNVAYRTKTRISQWETQLDSRFLRIHRSFIVNTARIDRCCPAHVEIGGMTIEISRKYREAARRRLTEQAANA